MIDSHFKVNNMQKKDNLCCMAVGSHLSSFIQAQTSHLRNKIMWKWFTTHFHQRLTRYRLPIGVSGKYYKEWDQEMTKAQDKKCGLKKTSSTHLPQTSTFNPTSPTLYIWGVFTVRSNLGKTKPETKHCKLRPQICCSTFVSHKRTYHIF